MNPSTHFKSALIMGALLALSSASVHAATQTTLMSKADYKSGKARISADYKMDKRACESKTDNAEDVCVEEAKGKEKIARAELEFAYSGKAADHDKVRTVKAEAAYAIADEKCDDHNGNAKDVCMEEAKAVKTKAMTDVKLGKEVTEAVTDATEGKLRADYKVATEKCDSMTMDNKSNCVAEAKIKFKQN